MSPEAQNLIDLYQRNAQREQDIRWYADAREAIEARAAAIGLPANVYTGIVAAASASTRWQTKDGRLFNLDRADIIIRWHRGELDSPRHMPSVVSAATRVLEGADPETVLGPKTRAFYLALLGGDHVVLDRWALRAIGYKRETVKEREVDAAAAPYFEAATTLGILPSELQAATWTQIRRETT